MYIADKTGNVLIDTHAHMYAPEFAGDIQETIDRAEASGVRKIYLPNVDMASIDAMLALEQRFPDRCVACMGLHPCSVGKDFRPALYAMEEWLSRRAFAAVGEIGTDLYWDKTFWDQQKEAFLIQLEWSRQYGLPVIIHCRESIDQTIELVESVHHGRLRGVFHCFGGTKEQAQRIIRLGFYLGIGGILTFKKSALAQVLADIPMEHLVLETDSPYLAPVPHRGKRNEPAYLRRIAEQLALAKGLATEEVADITTRNANVLFSTSTHN